MTRKQKVHELLKSRYPDWVTNWEITDINCGAVAGLRRLREIRKELKNKNKDFDIEKKRLLKDGKATGTWIYRLKIHDESGQLKLAI